MAGDHWTFLVVRGRNGPVQQYSLSTRTLRTMAISAAVSVLAVCALVMTLGLDGAAAVRAEHLAAENEALLEQLDGFQRRVGSLEASFDQIQERDARYRTVAGLETIDPEVMEVGVGGPGLGTPESSALWSVDSTSSKEVFAVSYDLSALERRARLLAASLTEATDSMRQHRALLEAMPSILPTSGWLTSTFSMSRMHPIHHMPLPHPGIDVYAPKGTPIYAAANGTVIRAGWVVGYGETVEIDHGFGFSTLYGHASEVLVTRGQKVSRGDVVALVGSTGVATGTNLHYEVRVNGVETDPENYILPEKIW